MGVNFLAHKLYFNIYLFIDVISNTSNYIITQSTLYTKFLLRL